MQKEKPEESGQRLYLSQRRETDRDGEVRALGSFICKFPGK